MTPYVYYFLAATLLSFLITPIAIWVAGKIGALDRPDARKVHQAPIPRLGGLAIFATTVLCLGAAIGLTPGIWEHGPWANVLVGALIIYLLGFTDDLGSLSAVSKLIVQFMAAFVAVASGLVLDAIHLPFIGRVDFGFLAIPITMIWIVGVTNAFNLIDGLDGLAGGLGLIAVLALFALKGPGDPGVALIAVILAGSLAGFIRYNFNPARIFMGDSGSLFVGYLVACLSVRTSWGENAVYFAAPLVILAVPLLDTATAMLRRYVAALKAGGKLRLRALLQFSVMFVPDRGHIHHRLLDSGLTQRQAVLILYLLSTVLAGLGLYASASEVSVAWTAVLAGFVVFFAVRYASSKAAHG